MTDDRNSDHDTAADHHTTTVVHTERRGSGGGIALAVVVLLILFVLFMFRNEIFGAADNLEAVDVEVTTNGS
ncbi:MAG: hypothetical protein M3Q15_00910 [Pseudomonadota bacterium]|nr:hypothetical protein [Pseudomonadota bacterium]